MFSPVPLYRLSRLCRELGIPKVASALQRLNYLFTGCDLPPTVRVGRGVRFQHHGAGVIVNGNVDIGDETMIMPHVVIGQNVREGCEVVELDRIVIGRRVMLGAGAKIIASGRLEIGDDAAVGANSVVTRSVDASATVAGAPARPLERRTQSDD